eukprot:2460904-Pyramimonas_sp.AAC.1
MAKDLDEAACLLPYDAIRDVAADLNSFAGAEAMRDFCAVDLNDVRSRAFGVCFPPPEWRAPAVPTAQVGRGSGGGYVCKYSSKG